MGGVTGEAARERLTGVFGVLDACYRGAGYRGAKAGAALTLMLKVEREGRVGSVGVRPQGDAADRFLDCARRPLEALRFPPLGGGQPFDVIRATLGPPTAR